MARFCGMIGFVQEVQTVPGVWDTPTIERLYYGDVTRNTRKWEPADQRNDNLVINNTLSILADDFALANCGVMRYAVLAGSKWKITNVEPQHPRIILTLGGIYNG